MAGLVGGAFLSSLLQVAFERLASPDFLHYFRSRKIDEGLLRKLNVTLISVDKIVEDAEQRQYGDHRVKQWLEMLKDEVFKAQDLLDDIATEASHQKLDAEAQTSAIRKVRGFFTSRVDRKDKNIESGIKEVLDSLDHLIKQNEILGLREEPSAGVELGPNNKVYRRLPSTGLIDESDMYGRDADKERIVEILLSPNRNSNTNQSPMDVIAITGMGGMGKTTLARLVYEDARMEDQFQHTAWLCVSEKIDVDQLTKEILLSLNCEIEELHDFHSRQVKLKEELKGKKFFLVLDDVWNENCKVWEVFQAPLKHVAPQSKILVTTRSRTVAELMCCTSTHSLKPLEGGDCWNLFVKHAFNNQLHVADPDLIQIGREIVNKCGGLPLAIKTLASLLHRKLSFQYWDKILKSDIWQLPENDSNIIPSLRLSYHYLPSYLKRCFAYCSVFPKDYDIEKNDLIQLWMADGLIYHPTQRSMSLEEAGEEIFNDLESRSFFQPSRKGDGYFTMHDLVNDLARLVMGEFFVEQEVDGAKDISTKARYFFNRGKEDANLKSLEKVFKCRRLRSFLLLRNFDINCDIMSRLSHLKYLRELSFRGCEDFDDLTDGISSLKHLHYLDLSETKVRELPTSMCLLINLQTLKLRGCYYLHELPSKFYELINLRHLDLEECGIQKMPRFMGKLNQLRTMNRFVVSEKGGANIKELGALKHLTGSLTLSNMRRIKDATDAGDANLKEKQLDTLTLQYGSINDEVAGEQWEEQVLEALGPIYNVKKLNIDGYRGSQFPKWLTASSSHLVSLYLCSCANNQSLPPLGQLPSLQKLVITGFKGIKVIGEEFYGNGPLVAPFPCLSYLGFYDMREWEEWDICYEGASFPCLEELQIRGCPRLRKSLPQHLPCLKTLNISGCGNLEAALPKSSSMEKLYLNACEKIRVRDMPTWSSSEVPPPLHELYLWHCPAMESLPQGVMLSSLQRLSIGRCSKVIGSCRDLGLHELLSLKDLVISDDFDEDTELFLPEEGLLPPNLQSLSFTSCRNLRRINHRGLVHLRSLTSLSFYGCPNMSFEDMPQDGLPPSLSHLTIGYCCRLLKERCERERGPDWPKIAHIPHLSL